LNELKLSTQLSTDIFVGRVTSRYISDVSHLCLSHGAIRWKNKAQRNATGCTGKVKKLHMTVD